MRLRLNSCIVQVAGLLGLSVNMLYGWRRDVHCDCRLPVSEPETPEQQIKR